VNNSAEQLHRIYEAMERLRSRPEGDRLAAAREIEREFGSAILDYVAAALKVGMPITHVVVLVHGIRDDGEWFRLLERSFRGFPQMLVSFGGFGYLPLTRFLSARARRETLDQVVATLRNAQGHNRVVSVLCHSLGTWCVTRAILEFPDVHVFRLAMCGSIVPREFPWASVPGNLPVGSVVNECGNSDFWPVVARKLSRVFGDTGRFGFAHDPVRDRWHDVDHGGFLNEEMVSRYWVPFFTRGEITDSQVTMRKPGLFLGLLAGRLPWPLKFAS
jgi:pimeloyl-ACP methyl ester carboxylesterase